MHGSKFHYQWAHSTVAHNGVLVNGESQIKHTPAPHGRIADFRFTPEWDYVMGDARDAYGGRLTRARRHVVFVKGTPSAHDAASFIVLYDDLAAKEPATFQFMLHALQAFAVDEPQSRLSVQQPHAGVDVQYLSPVPLAFRQWDGYAPPPSKEFPNQWHVEASTRGRHQELALLTVLMPYRAGQRPTWSAERVETDATLAVRVVRDGKDTTVSFPKPDRRVPIRVE